MNEIILNSDYLHIKTGEKYKGCKTHLESTKIQAPNSKKITNSNFRISKTGSATLAAWLFVILDLGPCDFFGFWNLCIGIYLAITLNSVLRFIALPSSVSLLAIGCVSPYPLNVRRSGSIPLSSRYDTTA